MVAVAAFLATPIAGTLAIAGGITYGAVLTTTMLIANSVRSYRQARKAQDNIKDVLTPVRASAPERSIVYGKTRVSGPLIYHTTYGSKRENVAMVLALAGHEVHAIDEVWFNDASIGTLGGYDSQHGAYPVQSGSAYYKSVPAGQFTEEWTGGTTSSTHQIAYASTYNFTALDTLVYVTPVVSIEIGLGEGGTQTQYISGGETVVMVAGTDYTVSGTGLVTMLNANANGNNVVATFRLGFAQPKAWATKFLGTSAGTADGWLESSSGGEWLSDMVGKSVARLRVNLAWDETMYATGLPAVSAVVSGAKVYDPRLDSTNGGIGTQRADTYSTWAYSNNSALVTVDFLRRATHEGGFGALSSEVDWPSVIAAANVCDEPVNTSGSGDPQARYQTDHVLTLSESDTRQEGLQSLLDAFDGMVYWSGGKWYVRAAAVATSVLTLDETDLAGGDITLKSKQDRRELFNAVRGRYRDPTQKYAVTDFPPYESAAYVTEDNGQTIWRDFDLPAVSDPIRAQRIAKLIMHRARQAVTFEATWKLSAYKIQPGDGVEVTIARYGWTSKLFRVLKREFVSLQTVKLTLQEDAAAVYAWSYTEQTNVDPAPNTALPKANQVHPPISFSLNSSADTFRVLADGTIVPFVVASWSAPLADDFYTEVMWKRLSDTAFRVIRTRAGETFCYIEPVGGGEIINVQAVHVNALGARSAPVIVTPYYSVSSLLPKIGEQVPTSANLIPNSTYEAGASRWAYIGMWGGGTGTGRIDPPSFHNAAYTIPGPVRNAVGMVYSTASGSITAAWQSEEFVVVPGDMMAAFAELHPIGTNAAAGIAFYTATGAYVGEIMGNTIVSVSSANPYEWAYPVAYGTSKVRGVVPAGARVGRFTVWANGNWWSTPQKYVSILRPFAGTVDPASTLSPAWTPSGSPVVDSPGIQIAATTEVFTKASSTLQFGAGGSTGSTGHRLTGPAFTTTYGGTLEIALSFKYVVTAPATNAILIGGVFDHITNGTGTFTSKTPYTDLFVVPAGTTDVKTFSLTGTLQVAASSTIGIDLILSRAVIETPTASGIVNKPVGGGVNALDRIESSLWRCTLIKR